MIRLYHFSWVFRCRKIAQMLSLWLQHLSGKDRVPRYFAATICGIVGMSLLYIILAPGRIGLGSTTLATLWSIALLTVALLNAKAEASSNEVCLLYR